MTSISPAPVVKEIRVACPPEHAFQVFATGMGGWWLKSHSVIAAEQADVIVEPRSGGRWYEVGTDGSTCDWGSVQVWDPPSRLVLVWRLSAEFRPDPTLHTEVEVTFTPEAGGTRVRPEHRCLDAFGDAAEHLRGMFDSPGGWGGLVEAFGRATAA